MGVCQAEFKFTHYIYSYPRFRSDIINMFVSSSIAIEKKYLNVYVKSPLWLVRYSLIVGEGMVY